MKGRKPDYRISALNKVTEERGVIGAAWANPDGSISIVFDTFTVVPVGKDYVITAFPEKPKPAPGDDIPF